MVGFRSDVCAAQAVEESLYDIAAVGNSRGHLGQEIQKISAFF